MSYGNTTGGGFLAPRPTIGGGGFARTAHQPGSSSTVTGGGGAVGGGGISDLLRRALERKLAPAPAPRRAVFGAKAAKSRGAVPRQPGGEGAARKSPAMEALEARQAADAYEMTRRSAARKPISGFNYMGWDQGIERLPSSFRPDAAGVAPGATRVPTGSIASPVYDQDSLYGYSASNPRSDALDNLRYNSTYEGPINSQRQNVGQASPIDQLTQGRRQWTPPR
jgi:hypothetical protein